MTAQETTRQGTPYDATYKACFSDPRTVESLLRGYADKAIVEGMDFSTLTPYPTEFVTPLLGTLRNDCIWKAQFHGKDCYVLILLEFQSTNDRFMALRVMAYIACLWLHIQKTEKLGSNDTLPPVFPMVIYNGKAPWSAPVRCIDLIGDLPENLRPYQGLQYYLLDIGRIAENLVRDGKGNAATLIRLERAATPEALLDVFREIIELDNDPENNELRIILTTYFKVLASRDEILGEAINRMPTTGEKSMLLENLQEMVTNLKNEGKHENAVETVWKMLKEKCSTDLISRVTGFSVPEVERIAAEHSPT